MSELLG